MVLTTSVGCGGANFTFTLGLAPLSPTASPLPRQTAFPDLPLAIFRPFASPTARVDMAISVWPIPGSSDWQMPR